jgi:hypothetical protein
MGMVAHDRRIGSAFFVFCGRHGEISAFAQQQGISRQWVYREAKQVSDALEGTQTRVESERLRQENEALRARSPNCSNAWRRPSCSMRKSRRNSPVSVKAVG